MLFVAEPYRHLFQQLGLQSVEAISRFFLGTTRSDTSKVVVRPATVPTSDDGPLDVFFKQYHYARPAWTFVGRRSKARCEFENYGVFAQLHLATAEPMAVGEDRDALGRLRRAFILTRAIPDAQTLVEFMQGPARDRSQTRIRKLRRELISQLAAMTRRIHAAGFFHHDLVWRNVLVTNAASAGEEARLWWIDCPRGKFTRWSIARRRRRLKDLASLDKPAGRWCTRGERVLFVKRYLEVTRLNEAAKRLIRDTLRYRKQRWPEDWDGG